MTLSNLEWLRELFNATKHRAVFLRRLSFLLMPHEWESVRRLLEYDDTDYKLKQRSSSSVSLVGLINWFTSLSYPDKAIVAYLDSTGNQVYLERSTSPIRSNSTWALRCLGQSCSVLNILRYCQWNNFRNRPASPSRFKDPQPRRFNSEMAVIT